jgi:hypothetical protein
MMGILKLDVTRRKLSRAENNIKTLPTMLSLNAMGLFAIGNCPDHVSENDGLLSKRAIRSALPVDSFNNSRLNQAVAEDRLLPSAWLFPESITHCFPGKLGKLSTTNRDILYVSAKAPKDERPVGRGYLELTAYD